MKIGHRSGWARRVEATPSERMPRDIRSSTAGTGGRSGGSSSSSSSSSSASGAAVDAGGSTITDPGVAPLASTTVTASPATSSTVNLVWTDIAGESGYRVERSADGASGWTTAASLPENATTATDTALAANTTYYYRVIATTKAGDASVSDVISTTTLLDPPAAPTMIAVPVSSTQYRPQLDRRGHGVRLPHRGLPRRWRHVEPGRHPGRRRDDVQRHGARPRARPTGTA